MEYLSNWSSKRSARLSVAISFVALTVVVSIAPTLHASADIIASPAIVAGMEHTCALSDQGRVWCWGENGYGSLGDGTNTDSNVPVAAAGLTDAVAISSGVLHTCALRATGTVVCWGRNDLGQLGHGTNTNSNVPVAVSGLTGATAIGSGGNHTCAIVAGGAVKCWGYNYHGQLGNAISGVGTNSNVPVDVTTSAGTPLTGATAIDGGLRHECAIVASGAMKCWGHNAYGQLGTGNTNESNVPVDVTTSAGTPLTGISVLGMSDQFSSCAMSGGGTVSCWGRNDGGQLGNGTVIDSSVPVTVMTSGGVPLSGVISVGSGLAHTCAALTNGTAKCWGDGSRGQLGNGTDGFGVTSNVPIVVPNLSGVIAVGAGYSHTCAILRTGAVRCWGENLAGQLGIGTNTNSNVPIEIQGLVLVTPIVASSVPVVSSGEEYACAIIDGGMVRCWGRNSPGGQLGNGTFINSSVPVTVMTSEGVPLSGAISISTGATHSCAALANGTARCWGENGYGSLGDGEVDGSTATTATTVLTGVGGPPLANVVAVSVGGYFSCALIANGTVACWGDNGVGQLGNGSGAAQSDFPVQVTRNVGGLLTGVTEISAGEFHVCARRTNGTVECWGHNNLGQLGDGSNTSRNRSISVTGLTTVTSVSSGAVFTCALLADTTVRCWGENDKGQLGDGSTPGLGAYNPLPVTVQTPSNGTLSAVTSVDVGKKTACALQVDTYVKCWGEGTYGNLGRGDFSDSNVAVSVIAANGLPLEGVASIDVGNVNACAVMTDGSVKCWGANTKGQIGDGTIGGGPTGRPSLRPVPTTVVNLMIAPIVAPAPVVALWSATLDPAGGSCVDGAAHTEAWTAFFLGYRYLPGASDCTRNGFAFAGWANTTTPTTLRTFPELVDPSDGALRSFVAENVTLVAVWNPLPATPKFFIGISNWLCNNCGVLLAWDTPAGNPTVTVTNGSSINVCANTTIAIGPWTLCHVKTGRPGTYTLTTSNTTGSSQPITTVG